MTSVFYNKNTKKNHQCVSVVFAFCGEVVISECSCSSWYLSTEFIMNTDCFRCILATDMSRHNEVLNKFKSILPVFDFTNKDHRDVVRLQSTVKIWKHVYIYLLLLFVQLMTILIKVSDISNEARPMEVAEPWLDCLLQEFFNQVPTPAELCQDISKWQYDMMLFLMRYL